MTTKPSDLAFQVHDLRNNIGGVLSFLDLLTHQQPDLLDQTIFVSAVEALQGAVATTEQISASIDSEDEPPYTEDTPEKITVAVHSHISEYIKPEYEALNRQSPLNVSFSCSLMDEDKQITFYPRQVLSLRENIISNAFKAGATELKVQYAMKDYGFVMTFTDNGKGMDEDEINKLLLRQAGDGKVHGLGTRSVLRTTQTHHAVISYSSLEGQGTRVKILLPYVES